MNPVADSPLADPKLAWAVTLIALALALVIAFYHLADLRTVPGMPPPTPAARAPTDTANARLDSIWYRLTVSTYDARMKSIKDRQTAMKDGGPIAQLTDLLKLFTTAIIGFVFGKAFADAIVALARSRELHAQARLEEAQRGHGPPGPT